MAVDAYPVSIDLDRASQVLRITWDDAHGSELGAEALRWACPCAVCQGELGYPGELGSTTSLSPDQVTLETVQLVGRYAVALTWKDGHSTGIYTFGHLRQLCPCDTCRSEG